MKDIIVKYNITFKSAFKILNKTGQKCLVISDDNNLLLGTFTDGDIRKAILKGVQLNSTIKNYYKKNPITISEKDYNEKVKEIFIKNKFDLIPVVDKNKKIVKIIFGMKFLHLRKI